jgi:hypothetical protein
MANHEVNAFTEHCLWCCAALDQVAGQPVTRSVADAPPDSPKSLSQIEKPVPD